MPMPSLSSTFVPNGADNLVRSSMIFLLNPGSANAGHPRCVRGFLKPSVIG